MSYTHELIKIEDDLYLIKDVQAINKYLIVGSKRALLIDTGFGFTDFKDLIQSITDLPYFVVNSHAHVDHASGNFLFDLVHISIYDFKNLVINDEYDYKMEQVEYRLNKPGSMLKHEINIEDYMSHSIFDTNYVFIDDGYTFDLGDRIIEVISVPGHSSGSIMLYDQKTRNLFTGDSVMKYNIYYMLEDQEPFVVYLHSLEKLNRRREDFKSLYPAHGEYGISVDYINDIRGNILDLLVNHEHDEPFEAFANMSGFKHYYKDTLVLYSTKRLEELKRQYRFNDGGVVWS